MLIDPYIFNVYRYLKASIKIILNKQTTTTLNSYVESVKEVGNRSKNFIDEE